MNKHRRCLQSQVRNPLEECRNMKNQAITELGTVSYLMMATTLPVELIRLQTAV